MSLRIANVRPGSLADRHAVRGGDELVSLNGRAVEDHLDILYAGAEEVLDAEFRRDGEVFNRRIVKPYMEDLGLEFDPLSTKWCGDDCIFCFVHQNPNGVRSSLMVQDEDYRLSFLHGSYVTLDNLREAEFERIIEMRLSPLYVSVHATDPDLRSRMLRGKRSGEMNARMERLVEAGIQMHTQVVLVPGWNDGEQLRRTVHDLAERYPGVLSIALVPVGLTDHREGLARIRRLTPLEMRETLAACGTWREGFYDRLGCGFVYPADEFFLASGTTLPDMEWYDDFCQEENGVGMAVEFIEEFKKGLPDLEAALAGHLEREGRPLRVTACSGVLGAEMFRRHLLEPLAALPGIEFTLLETPNTFFGRGITIAGLLTSRCFAARLEGADLEGLDAVLLPSNCTNEEDVFLDDVTLSAFSSGYPCEVRRGSYDLAADLSLLARTASRTLRAAG